MNPDVSQIYDSFAASYLALGRVADPSLAGELPPENWYQCVSLVKPYLAKYGIIAGRWGDASTYWSNTRQAIKDKFQRLEISEPQKGDIVILSFDHIGIANGVVQGTSFQMLDQNGGAASGTGTSTDAIQIHVFKKSSILGVLRPLGANVAPAPAPGPRYQVVETYPYGRQIQLNKRPTNLWGMNYDFQFMVDHPVEVHNQGETWIVTDKVRHEDGYEYYRREGQVDGFNVLDCSDYTPPEPELPPVSTAPAAPVPYTAAEQYTLVTVVKTFKSPEDAMNPNGQDAIGELSGGVYFVWTKQGKAYNLTKDNMQPGAWVNTLDNVIRQVEAKPEPAPQPVIPAPDAANEAWKSTLHPLLTSRKSVRFKVLRDMYVTDLAGSGKGVEINASRDDESTWLPIQYWVVKNNMLYLVPFLMNDPDHKYYFAIPTTDIDSGLPNLQSQLYATDVKTERDYRREQGRMTIEDQLYYAKLATNLKISKLIKAGTRFLDGIIQIKKK
jgi:hypothetical protein